MAAGTARGNEVEVLEYWQVKKYCHALSAQHGAINKALIQDTLLQWLMKNQAD